MKVTALLSCYNEAGRIRGVLEPLSKSPLIEKIVVVDAASTDGSQEIIRKFESPKLKPIFLSKKVGKGEAIARGVKEVETEAVFLCDIDNRGLKTEHIRALIETFEAQPRQMVVGLREKPLSFISHWVRKNFLPLIAGERVVSTRILKQAIRHPLSTGWGPEIYLNYYCKRKGIKITKILLKGVNDLPKWKKGHGVGPFVYEAFDVVRKYAEVYCICFPRDLLQSYFAYPKEKRKGFVVKKVKVDGTSINFAKTGRGEKILVFVHGWANNWEGWLPLAEILRKKYTLYLVDLPGFGDSGDLKEYTIQKMAQYLAKFLEKENLNPEAVIGLSMGSLVTASLGKLVPQRVRKIVLLGAVLKSGKKALVAKALEKALGAINKNTPAEVLIKKIIETRMAAYLLAKYVNMHKFNRFLVDAYGMVGKKKMRKEAFVQMGISAARFRLEKVLESYPLPLLFIYGEDDKITSIDQAKQCLPQGPFEFVSIPQAGHVVAWEQPKMVAQAISRFVEQGNRVKTRKS